MTARTAQPLVQIAARDRVVGGRWALRRGSRRVYSDRWGRHSRRASGRGRRLLLARSVRSLPMSDKILIAWSAGPRWSTGRLASCPVRPGIGNGPGNLGAGSDNETKAERQQRQGVPLKYHVTCWIVPLNKRRWPDFVAGL
jgi:hypothetical protein